MINKVVIRRFKRFDEITFNLPGHVVIAGPNNTGKTTLLQAIAAWSLGLREWRSLNDFVRRNSAYTKKPIARQAFSAVPLRRFDLLWNKREYNGPIEIEMSATEGWTICMEFLADSTEQAYVRPKANTDAAILRTVSLPIVYVPPMTGLGTEEAVYQPPKIEQLLGSSRPGEVLRNLLVEAHHSEIAWRELQKSIKTLFGYELCPPDATGANILVEYIASDTKRYDIASAGSGFQQVLMLLTFLNTRKGSLLLLDEPDAHLHIILQDAIYGELKAVARRENSQLIIATHSEVIIDSVELKELCVLLDKPIIVTDEQQRRIVADSLRILSNTDIMLALNSPGILYVEGKTDINILRELARVLGHPLYELLKSPKLFWKPIVSDQRVKGTGIDARNHYNATKLVRTDIPALELVDGDSDRGIQSSEITGQGFQRLRWKRREIESYLVHPTALARFVQKKVGTAAAINVEDLNKYFVDNFPPAFIRDPLGDYTMLDNTKARTEILPPALSAAGLKGMDYTEYYEIAAVMLPEEIHPEVKEKLDLIQKAFRL
ncbi:MAG: AAA family ATPase [Bacteroidota bacterium]